MDSRIGILQREGGQVFYAFAHGYDKPETVGTMEEVERALGVKECGQGDGGRGCEGLVEVKRRRMWDVTMRFQHPAWDEKEGILYRGIEAQSKAEANGIAGRLARRDGHAIGGRGRYSFSAVEVVVED